MGSSSSPDSLLEVSPIPCLCHVIREEVNKLFLLLDSPLTVFFHHWITTWVGCLCVGVTMLRAIGRSMDHGVSSCCCCKFAWDAISNITSSHYSNLTPHFGPFPQKKKTTSAAIQDLSWWVSNISHWTTSHFLMVFTFALCRQNGMKKIRTTKLWSFFYSSYFFCISIVLYIQGILKDLLRQPNLGMVTRQPAILPNSSS